MGIVLAILLFGFIVFFHELGHFFWRGLMESMCIEFWIGMGPNTGTQKDQIQTTV